MSGRHVVPDRRARLPLACLLAAALVTAAVPVAPAAAAPALAPSVATARAARDLSAGYMTRSVRSDGTFVYLVYLDGSKPPAEYNVVRHAGGVWALADYYRTKPSAATYDAIGRASRWLRDKRLRAVPGQSGLLAVWSDPVDAGGGVTSAKLGGAGLGLAALTTVERVRPGTTQLPSLRALAQFIVYMQKSDGSFYGSYIPSQGGRSMTGSSEYYPGEAALALAMLYEIDPQPQWLQASYKALTYLAKSRVNATNVADDHWALIATQKLLQVEPGAGGPVAVDRQLMLNHVRQICEAMLEDQVSDNGDPKYAGGFSDTGGTSATATRLEGLQAALGTLPANDSMRPRIQTAVGKALGWLLALQTRSGTYAGAIPHDPDSAEVRIDYVQHALYAMMRYVGFKPWLSRVAGSDRYATALTISRSGWPKPVEGVVVASGANYPDALAAAPLAKAYGGPVLLTQPSSLGRALTDELKRLAPKRVFVAGSAKVVSDAVKVELVALPSKPAVVRLGGADRQRTAELIAMQVKAKLGTPPKVVVVSGSNYADGMSAASLAAAKGWPILLAAGGTLTSGTRTTVTRLAPSSTLLVGTTVSLPASVASLVPSPTRVSGPDGPSTALAVAMWAKANAGATCARIGLATSAGFADGLTAAPYLARDGGLLLLSPPTGLPTAATSFLAANKAAVVKADVFGSASALSETAVYQAGGALQ